MAELYRGQIQGDLPPVTPEDSGALEKAILNGLEDSAAIALVNQTFDQCESFRQQNHDPRWVESDRFYFGWVPPRKWEGTQVPRSSLGVPITFDQVESALPLIINALFYQDIDWFDVEPLPGTTPQDAEAHKARLKYLLEYPRDGFGNTAMNEIDQAIKSVLLYGNGCLRIDNQPDGPLPLWVDVRDVFVDPMTNGPLIDRARHMLVALDVTPDELERYRGWPGMRLPAREELVTIAQTTAENRSDQTKQSSELQRNVSYVPQSEKYTPLPSARPIKLVVYYDKQRVIWVLNRQWLIFNEPNQYGFYPYVGAPCYNVLGRFYAQSISDVIGNDQRYIQGITNARLDELSLALNPPRGRKRGSPLSAFSQFWRPGLVQEFENPKDDMTVVFPQNITNSAFQEVALREMSASQRTGISPMLMQGRPIRGNASRTASAIEAQVQGPTSRLQRIVQMIENYMLVPLLYKMSMLDAFSAQQPEQQSQGFYGVQNGQLGEVSKESLLKKVRFTVKASSKMMQRQEIAQMFNFLAPYVFDGPFIKGLQAQGVTIDMMEMGRMIQDATGSRTKYSLFRPMNEQEQAALQQPPPQVMAMMQKAQMEAQTRQSIMQMKQQGTLMGKQMEIEAEEQKSDEKSATEILKLIARQFSDKLKARAEITSEIIKARSKKESAKE